VHLSRPAVLIFRMFSKAGQMSSACHSPVLESKRGAADRFDHLDKLAPASRQGVIAIFFMAALAGSQDNRPGETVIAGDVRYITRGIRPITLGPANFYLAGRGCQWQDLQEGGLGQIMVEPLELVRSQGPQEIIAPAITVVPDNNAPVQVNPDRQEAFAIDGNFAVKRFNFHNSSTLHHNQLFFITTPSMMLATSSQESSTFSISS
jgi:hypothetical protein